MNIIFKKSVIGFFLLSLFCSTMFAQNLFNNTLTQAEQQQLANGEIVIRNIGKAKNMCLNPITDGTQRVVDIIKDLNPSYLAEVIQIRPYAGNEDLIENLKPILLDIEGYVGIPYYSEYNDSYYDLYSSAQILSENISDTDGVVDANLHMDPFGTLSVNISFENTADDLFYFMTNTEKVKYKGFTVVQNDNMQSLVYAFRHGDSIVLYGIGGVDALSIFFLRDRIDTSFINRIKTFCQFVFEKL
ncbi:MAG: DUF6675 family protein [Spirochaetales bacterium]